MVSAFVQVWACETLREQFLSLPFSAVRCLLGSDATTVAAENTVLVALTGWVEEGTHGRSTTGAQRKELLSLVSGLDPFVPLGLGTVVKKLGLRAYPLRTSVGVDVLRAFIQEGVPTRLWQLRTRCLWCFLGVWRRAAMGAAPQMHNVRSYSAWWVLSTEGVLRCMHAHSGCPAT